MPQLLNIVGQDDAVGRLQAMLGGARWPHALLFAGPDGVGRRTTAVALAKTLLCPQPTLIPNRGRFPHLADEFMLRDACNHCPDCKMMESLSHPDFHMVYKELAAYHEDSAVRDRVMQELSIDVVRSFLIDPAYRRTARGKGKVFVVQEAELMSIAAQNALLKTLEEPPPGVTLILLTEQTETLLPTTLSRCSLLRLGLLPRTFVTEQLRRENVEGPEADFWAAFTEGSVGRAIQLAKQGLYEVKRDLLERLAAMNRAGDAELGELLVKTTEKLADALVKSTRTESTEMSRNLAVRQSAGILMELIASAYRDAMTLASGSARPIANSDQRAAVQALAGRFDPLELSAVVEQLSDLEQLLWRNVNPKTIWDNVVISCASAAPLRE